MSKSTVYVRLSNKNTVAVLNLNRMFGIEKPIVKSVITLGVSSV